MYLGCHLSSAQGFKGLADDAISIGANVFQFFTRNPRGGRAKDISQADLEYFQAASKAHGFGPILAHAPYTLNACSDKESIRGFAINTFVDDMHRMELIPGNMYNFHPGCHVGQGTDKGLELIADALKVVLPHAKSTTVLLETMAGKGSEIGGSFEELHRIIDMLDSPQNLGVCLDTCHIHDAGYDIVGNLDGVLKEFDSVIGLDKLRAIHLNDSKNPIGARKDRHEQIGKGYIGLDALCAVVYHPLLKHLPFYLETPQESIQGWGAEIALIRSTHTSV